MAIEQLESGSYAETVAAAWNRPRVDGRSFWDSPIVNAEINRRITGDPDITPGAYFVSRYCQVPFRRALSLGCGGGSFERELLEFGACQEVVGVDISPKRVAGGTAATPPHLEDRMELV
jgi:SAM-dependent methyltransferase